MITPTHRGPVGIQTLNQELQQRLNPESDRGPGAAGCTAAMTRSCNYGIITTKKCLTAISARCAAFWGHRPAPGGLTAGDDPLHPGERISTLAYAVTVHRPSGTSFPPCARALTTHHDSAAAEPAVRRPHPGAPPGGYPGQQASPGMAIQEGPADTAIHPLAARLRGPWPRHGVKMLDNYASQEHISLLTWGIHVVTDLFNTLEKAETELVLSKVNTLQEANVASAKDPGRKKEQALKEAQATWGVPGTGGGPGAIFIRSSTA